MSKVFEKFMDMLKEAIDPKVEETIEEKKECEDCEEEDKPRRGRSKKKILDLKAIEDEFKAAQDDEKRLNKLIMKYGDSEDDALAALVRKYMKYDKKSAEDFTSRDSDSEHSIRISK